MATKYQLRISPSRMIVTRLDQGSKGWPTGSILGGFHHNWIQYQRPETVTYALNAATGGGGTAPTHLTNFATPSMPPHRHVLFAYQKLLVHRERARAANSAWMKPRCCAIHWTSTASTSRSSVTASSTAAPSITATRKAVRLLCFITSPVQL